MDVPDVEQTKTDSKQLLIEALAKRWNGYSTELKNCLSEFTDESVHDLRVATRRMLALIQLLNSISPRPRLKKMSRAFKDQLDEFDTLRDTQVILAELNEILHELPQLEEFETHLRSLEAQMMQDLHTKLENRKTSKMDEWILKTQESLDADTPDDLESLILDVVDDAFLVVRQRLGWVDLARPATIHRVRVAFKAFRYMVEIVHRLLDGFPRGILKQMNDYQTLMGNIQDAEVFAQTFANFADRVSFSDLDAVRRYDEKRCVEAISAFVKAMDQLHTFWRPTPDQPFPWE
jgi:CHAD domain-containing protein